MQNTLARLLRRLLLLGVAGLFFSGCAIMRSLEKEERAIAESGVLSVRLPTIPDGVPARVVVTDSAGHLVAVRSVATQGEMVAFLVPVREHYSLVAWLDRQPDRRMASDEEFFFRENLTPVELANTVQMPRIHEVFWQRGRTPSSEIAAPPTEWGGIPFALGEVAELSEPRFAPERGTAGMWRPFSTLAEGNLGLYFVRPFQKGKMPVVFVHGIGGSPHDFATLLTTPPAATHQSWFFTYPSGFRLGKAANALTGMLAVVLREHGLTEVQIVAHSMGGLVARRAIQQLAEYAPEVRVSRFISISTPWNGHAAAGRGLRHLRHPVPSWIDMAAGSEFLQTLWARPLPRATRFWLIFGYDAWRRPWLQADNDQVIDLSSALYPPAQEAAVRQFGVQRDHEAILHAPEVQTKVREFLTAP